MNARNWLGGLVVGADCVLTTNWAVKVIRKRFRIETFRTSDPFDAAIIRFEQPELIAALQIGWHFLSPKDLSPIRADMPNCLVAGYPRVTARRAGWQLSPSFSALSVRFLTRSRRTP